MPTNSFIEGVTFFFSGDLNGDGDLVYDESLLTPFFLKRFIYGGLTFFSSTIESEFFKDVSILVFFFLKMLIGLGSSFFSSTTGSGV